MGNIQKKTLLILSVIFVLAMSVALVTACPPPPPPSPPGPGFGGPNGGAPPFNPGSPPDSGSTGGTGGADPVLLNTGEFLYTRTDGSVASINFEFPIVRSYRGKPEPLIRHLGMAIEEKIYSDWCIFTWDKPPVYTTFPDSCYTFDAEFTITPLGQSGSNYETTTVASAYEDMDYNLDEILPVDKDGIAIRFELGTGDSYRLKLEYTRTDPTWTWENQAWTCGSPYTEEEVYTWEHDITIEEWPAEDYTNTPTPEHSPLSGGQSNVVSDLGWYPGWDMSYHIHVVEYRDPNDYDEVDERKIFLYTGDTNIHKYTPSTQEHPVYGEVWKCSKRDDFLKKWSSGGYTLYRKYNETWQFTSDGYIQYITKQGSSVTFNYSSNLYGLGDTKRLDSIEDHFGRKTELVYTDSGGIYPGNLLKIVDHTGREWAYDYYSDGNLKSVTDPNGFKETYYYTSGILEKIEDNDGNIWLDNDYDVNGRVNSQILGNDPNKEYTINYTAPITVTDPDGWDTACVLNSDGYQTSRTQDTDTATVTTLFRYNTQNKLTKVTYPEGNGYDMVYDPNGCLTSFAVFSSDSQDPNLTYTYTYTDDDWMFLKTITDPRNNTTTYTYDYEDPNYSTSDGLLMKITYPEVPTDTDPNTPEISFTYDPNNQLETITSPDGIVLKYEYWDDAGEPNSIGKVKKVTLDYGTGDCLNIEYTFDYDGTGRVVDVNDPLGNTTTLTYNVLDLLAQVEDPSGNITKLSYNVDRKLKKVEREFNSGWQTFEYGYNIMAKLTSITDSLGNETSLDYDDRFQVNEVTDPNNNTTRRYYNARQLLKEIIDAEDGSTTFEYDDNGRLCVVTDAEDANTVYEYDGYGRLEFVTYANDSYEQYSYDAVGNLTSFRNRANETITFGYDALNRLVDKKVGTDPNIVLTYDIAGRLVEVSQSTDEMTFSYDRLGRLEETTDENSKTVGYDYDAMRRRTKLTYPDDSYITYHYDASGRLETTKDDSGNEIAHYYYDELSRTTAVVYYRGTSYVGLMGYDYEDKTGNDNLGNRIEGVNYYFNTSSSHSITYTYDTVGNVTSTDVGGASGYYGWTYGYDKVYQVTDANQILGTNREVDISYDAVYNRSSWADSLLNFTMSYQNNVLNQYTQVSFNGSPITPTYDNRGNCTYFGTGTFSYDEENRLVTAGSVSYTYDLLGRRISRTYNSVTTTYVWDGAHIIAEYVGSSLTKKYIYGPGMDNPVAMVDVDGETETWYYYYTDALGSVRLLSDAGGSIVESYTYWTYGQPLVMTAAGDGNWLTDDANSGTTGSSAYDNPYLFTARRWDSTTALYYYRFRDYSPLIGRFVQTDPAGYVDTMNLYAYCANNPINWIDPWGLDKGPGAGGPGFGGPGFGGPGTGGPGTGGPGLGRNIGERVGHVIGAGLGAGAGFFIGGGGLTGTVLGAALGAAGYDFGGDVGGAVGESIGSGHQPNCPSASDWERMGIPAHYIPGGGL